MLCCGALCFASSLLQWKVLRSHATDHDCFFRSSAKSWWWTPAQAPIHQKYNTNYQPCDGAMIFALCGRTSLWTDFVVIAPKMANIWRHLAKSSIDGACCWWRILRNLLSDFDFSVCYEIRTHSDRQLLISNYISDVPFIDLLKLTVQTFSRLRHLREKWIADGFCNKNTWILVKNKY